MAIMRKDRINLAAALILAINSQLGNFTGSLISPSARCAEPADCASPTALAASPDGSRLFVACATANQVAVIDTASTKVAHRIDVPDSPTGLSVSADGLRLYVTCAAPSSTICVIDATRSRIIQRIQAGHTAMAPALSSDGKTLYVCNRFNDDVSVIDLTSAREVKRIRVEREPVAAAITPNGKYLVVANHLHAGAANQFHAGATVSVIDTATGQVAKNIRLTEGAGLMRGVAVSPDSRFAAVTFVRARFWLSTTGVELGRINANALGVLDMERLELLGILLLDQTAFGAANPWAVAWTPDGKTIVVSHAGTHELSLIDAPVEANPASFLSLTISAYANDGSKIAPPPKHPVRVRKRVPIPGNGPRALAIAGSQLYVANYFSDTLSRIGLTKREPKAELLPLTRSETGSSETLASGLAESSRLLDRDETEAGAPPVVPMATQEGMAPSLIRRGEMLFNDAQICSQGWQSCASCHDTDGRTDGFNWDLLNDGIGNPKNTKSLLWSHQTAPVMALGVRANAEVAVRAGIHHILFTEQPDDVPAAIDAYLMSLRPVPSPHLVNGTLSGAAERGKELFLSAKVGCADCHPPPLFTDFVAYDVGTAEEYRGMHGVKAPDKPEVRFDTPSLVELWRTAPYLHTGSAAALRDVLTKKNPNDRHGCTSHLTQQEIDDLVAYLLTL